MKNRKLLFSFSILMMLTCYFSFAQSKTVSGTVTDDQGLPLPGVNITIQGTTTGTQTDFDGNYSISAAEGETLVFSYLGFQNQQVIITSTSTYNVTDRKSVV